jgi:hypothetical protein
MKKIIGVLGVAVIAVAMFLTTNVVNKTSSDISLMSLVTINEANAEANATSCTVTTTCMNSIGDPNGSVSCTGAKCSRTWNSVTCDGSKTTC